MRAPHLHSIRPTGLGSPGDIWCSEGTEKPDRGPRALALRHLGHYFKTAIGPRCRVAGVDTGRGVAMPFIVNGGGQEAIRRLLPQLDQETMAIHTGVLQAVHGVILELVMADVSFFISP